MDEREYLTIHIHVIHPSSMWKGFSGEIDSGHLLESLEQPLENLTVFVKLSPARQIGILEKLTKFKDIKPENIIVWETNPNYPSHPEPIIKRSSSMRSRPVA